MNQHTEATDRLADCALRNDQLRSTSDCRHDYRNDYRNGYAEGLIVAWEMLTGHERDTDHDAMEAAAKRHRAAQAPIGAYLR